MKPLEKVNNPDFARNRKETNVYYSDFKRELPPNVPRVTSAPIDNNPPPKIASRMCPRCVAPYKGMVCPSCFDGTNY